MYNDMKELELKEREVELKKIEVMLQIEKAAFEADVVSKDAYEKALTELMNHIRKI